jgi:tRNA A-37 threonylcarbamoyl transferase component Bud32
MAIPTTGADSGSVFLSYRREDTRHLAGRLYDRLAQRFGHEQTFMDVDSIEPGADFAAAIDSAVAACDVLVALIGPGWLHASDGRGERRLNDPDDFVVLEITAALRRKIRILPVLVDGAMPPPATQLPEALVPLARRNAMRLDHETFRSDVDAVLEAVAKMFETTRSDPADRDEESDVGAAERTTGQVVDAGTEPAETDPARSGTSVRKQAGGTDQPYGAPPPVDASIQSRAAVHPSPANPPTSLAGRYLLGETLSYGGMSELRRGVDTHLGRNVLVKIFRADLARDPQLPHRLQEAVQNARALNHPGIVAVYDSGEVDTASGPLFCLVMEYVDGHTLREVTRTRGPMSFKQVTTIASDVCGALDFSHKHNIVHRDIKPANILISSTGKVKVMGFGIARSSVIGTAHYLSPEQARGNAVDSRSDIYALGCVLFELLTGRPPFTGETPVAVAYQQIREEPRRPSKFNTSIPASLDAVVLRALTKNPDNRYQTAAEMRADLMRVSSSRLPLTPRVWVEDEHTELARRTPAGHTGRIDKIGTRTTAMVSLSGWFSTIRGHLAEKWRMITAVAVTVMAAAGIVALTIHLIPNG